MKSGPKLQVEGLSKWYATAPLVRPRLHETLLHSLRTLGRSPSEDGGFWALKDVSFSLNPGDRLGVIGYNGSGKSTLLRLLARITAPTAGRIVARGRVSSLLEVGAGFHPDVSGRENIFLYGSILGMSRRDIRSAFDAIVDFSEVGRFLDLPVKRYSTGMYLRLAFSVCVHLRPDILLVDEVMTVGDWAFQQKCRTRIREMVGQGVTLVLVSHDLKDVDGLCDRALWLNGGRVAAYGAPTSVITQFCPSAFESSPAA